VVEVEVELPSVEVDAEIPSVEVDTEAPSVGTSAGMPLEATKFQEAPTTAKAVAGGAAPPAAAPLSLVSVDVPSVKVSAETSSVEVELSPLEAGEEVCVESPIAYRTERAISLEAKAAAKEQLEVIEQEIRREIDEMEIATGDIDGGINELFSKLDLLGGQRGYLNAAELGESLQEQWKVHASQNNLGLERIYREDFRSFVGGSGLAMQSLLFASGCCSLALHRLETNQEDREFPK